MQQHRGWQRESRCQGVCWEARAESSGTGGSRQQHVGPSGMWVPEPGARGQRHRVSRSPSDGTEGSCLGPRHLTLHRIPHFCFF